MTWFNAYELHNDGLTRKVVTKVDLNLVPYSQWTDDELGYRLAVIYPLVDGREHETASQEIKHEVISLIKEIKSRGYDPFSNLLFNERNTGRGWLPGFDRLVIN